jgi:hypothetical protein
MRLPLVEGKGSGLRGGFVNSAVAKRGQLG